MNARGGQLEGEPARGLEVDIEEEGGSIEGGMKRFVRRATLPQPYLH